MGEKIVELNATHTSHIASKQMDRNLNFTALMDFMMMMHTTTAKAAIITGLMVPPTEMRARKSLHGPSANDKWRALVTILTVSVIKRTPKPAVKLAMRMLATTK